MFATLTLDLICSRDTECDISLSLFSSRRISYPYWNFSTAMGIGCEPGHNRVREVPCNSFEEEAVRIE